jgi:predicted tellurium resistance membrane protein TerC
MENLGQRPWKICSWSWISEVTSTKKMIGLWIKSMKISILTQKKQKKNKKKKEKTEKKTEKKEKKNRTKNRKKNRKKTEKNRKLYGFQIKFCEDKKSCFCDV